MTSLTKIEKKINFQPLTIKSHVYTMNMCALKLGNLGMCTTSIYKLFTWRYLPIFGIWGITLTCGFLLWYHTHKWGTTTLGNHGVCIIKHTYPVSFYTQVCTLTIHFIFLQNCRWILLLQIVLLSDTLKWNKKWFRVVYNRKVFIVFPFDG